MTPDSRSVRLVKDGVIMASTGNVFNGTGSNSPMTDNQYHTVGIDLGTTFRAVAKLGSAHRFATVPNADGDLTIPSVVFFDDDSIIVGQEAATLEPNQITQFNI